MAQNQGRNHAFKEAKPTRHVPAFRKRISREAAAMSLSKKARKAMLGTRGSASQHASIWQLKSPASQMIPLVGDLRMQLFYYCEGDPDLLTANYAPSAILLPPNDVEFQPDVVATLCSRLEQYIFFDDGSDEFGRIRSAIGDGDLRFRQISLRDL